MARMILTVLLMVLLNVLVGCYGPDSGRSQFLPSTMKTVSVVDAAEADIIEHMIAGRMEYRQYLESLVAHYKKTGDNMKLGWAQNEMKMLNETQHAPGRSDLAPTPDAYHTSATFFRRSYQADT